MTPKFSVLSTCYNKEQFILDCVNSIINQTYKNWEHIIVDDCSTDKSFEILSSIKDIRVKVIRNDTRKFCSSSYAIALNHAKGDICGIVDGDDVLLKKAIEKIVKRYQEHSEIDFIYTQHFWCDKSLVNRRGGLSALPKKGKSLVDMVYSGKHCFSHWRTFRRYLSKKGVIFPENLEVSVDKNMGFTLEEIGKGAFLRKTMYLYRYYKGNMSLVFPGQQKKITLALARSYKNKRSKSNIHVTPIVEIK